MNGISDYIKDRYGICELSESTGKCDCLHQQKEQKFCKHYTPIIATSWETMIEIAKKRYSK
jgi:hypothetical protein